jgi:hypothetical protein
MKRTFIILVVLFFSLWSKSQTYENRYAIETTLDGKTPIVYEENTGSLQLNSSTGDLIFTTNLANFKTEDKVTDSLLSDQEFVIFKFTANVGQNIFGLINDQNADKYTRITGIILVNNVSYNTEASIRLNNLTEKSNMSKALVDMKLEVNPKVIKIPYISDYFKNILLFQVDDGYVNQNK